MKKINLLYEYDYDDVDILLVPERVADNICDVVQEFQNWLCVPVNKACFSKEGDDGQSYLSIDTEEFLWWLNNVKILDEPKASIVSQHGPWQKELPTADF